MIHHSRWNKEDRSLIGRLSSYLNQPVNIASIVLLRLLFGWLLAFEMVRHVYLGRVAKMFPEKTMRFAYVGFDWIEPLSVQGMNLVFLAIGLFAAGMAMGWYYRFSSVMMTALLGYVFLLDKSVYSNHLYLSLLLGLLLMVMPANVAWSVDARRRPIITADSAPRYCLWLLRIQIAITFLFSAVARIDPDWIMGQSYPPTWLAPSAHVLTKIGVHLQSLAELRTLYWFLLILDLVTFVGLLVPRTRKIAVWVVVFTFTCQGILFDNGIAPWLMIACATIFLDPSWPHHYRRLWPAFDERLLPKLLQQENITLKWLMVLGVVTYVGLQVIVPIRHLSSQSSIDWYGERTRFTWGLRDRNREVEVNFEVLVDGERRLINLHQYLSKQQIKALNTWPDLLPDFSKQLARRLQLEGFEVSGIFAIVIRRTPDGRRLLLVDPEANLLHAARWSFARAPWGYPSPPKAGRRSL